MQSPYNQCQGRRLEIIQLNFVKLDIKVQQIEVDLLADLLAFFCDVNCVFVTFPCGILVRCGA